MAKFRSPAGIAGILLLAGFALLYALTLDTGLRPGELEGGDLITHQYAQVEARFANAPGYPLYTMGGWLWFRLGRLFFGSDANPVPVLSSYSTFWAIVALGLLYALVLEALRRGPAPTSCTLGHQQRGAAPVPPGSDDALPSPRPERAQWEWLIAFLATAFYGVTYFFWYYAVTTEQYTSSVAWTLAAILLAFRWERLRRDRSLLWLALLVGIGLAHQVTVLAVIPPIAWLVLSRDRSILRRRRLLASVLGLALLPLLSYAFVYVRGGQHPEWRGAGEWLTTWQWFWDFVATGQGRSELTWSLRPFFTDEFPALVWRELTLPGLAAGILGWLALGRRRCILLYATWATYLAFCWVDRLGNWYQVIMPVYALLVVGIAAAGAHIERRLCASATGAARAAGRATILLALVALVSYRAAASYPRADCSDRPEDTALAPAWAILADLPPQRAPVLATQPEALALSYVIKIWGRRPDLGILTAEEARLHVAGAGFAVTEAALPLVPADVMAVGHLSALGRTLTRVRLTGTQDVPAGLDAWTHDYGGQVRLVAGGLQENPATGEQVVVLAWQAPAPPRDDWSVSVRLMQGGREIAQLDRKDPVFGAYPMTRWTAGEVVVDAYPFAVAPSLAVEGVKVLLYRRATGGSFTNLDAAEFATARGQRVGPP